MVTSAEVVRRLLLSVGFEHVLVIAVGLAMLTLDSVIRKWMSPLLIDGWRYVGSACCVPSSWPEQSETKHQSYASEGGSVNTVIWACCFCCCCWMYSCPPGCC